MLSVSNYAYSYGLIETLDNEIDNVYIKEIPLLLKFTEIISNRAFITEMLKLTLFTMKLDFWVLTY